jgi:hypothetical protein
MDTNWGIGKTAFIPDDEHKVFCLVSPEDGRIGCYEAPGRRGPLFFTTREGAQKFGSLAGWEGHDRRNDRQRP